MKYYLLPSCPKYFWPFYLLLAKLNECWELISLTENKLGFLKVFFVLWISKELYNIPSVPFRRSFLYLVVSCFSVKVWDSMSSYKIREDFYSKLFFLNAKSFISEYIFSSPMSWDWFIYLNFSLFRIDLLFSFSVFHGLY